MAVNKRFLINASVRHRVYLQRYAGGLAKESQRYYEKIKTFTLDVLKDIDLTNVTQKKLNAIYKEIDRFAKNIYVQMEDNLLDNLNELLIYEANFRARMYNLAGKTDVFQAPIDKVLQKQLLNKQLKLVSSATSVASSAKRKGTLTQAVSQFTDTKRKELVSTVKSSVIANRTFDEITEDLEDRLGSIQAANTNSLVRTAVNFTATVAALAVLTSSPVKEVEWVAVLDDATTEVCESLDGEVFPVDSGPRPPIHWGCRSEVTPIIEAPDE